MSDLPRGWVLASLEELGTWTGGGTPRKNNPEYWNGPVPWVSPKDMKSIHLTDTRDHISEKAIAESAAKPFPANSIALVVRSGILQRTLPVALVPFPATANQDIKILTPHQSVNPQWLLYALIGAAEEIRERCRKHGTTVASIEFDALKGFQIPVPPSRSQSKIVARIDHHLSAVGRGQSEITNAAEKLAILRDRAMTACIEEAGELIRGETVPLRQVTGHNGLFTDGDWILREHLERPGNDVRLIQLADLGVGEFRDVSERWISDEVFEELGCTEVKSGDLLCSRMADPLIRTCEVPKFSHRSITAVDVTIIRVDPTLAHARFVMWALNSRMLRAQAEALASGTTRKRISRKKLEGLRIPLPGLEIQGRLVSELEGHLAATTVAAQHLERGSARAALLTTRIFQTAGVPRSWTGSYLPNDQSVSASS